MAVRIRRNTPIQPNARPAIVALVSAGWVVREEPAGAVVMEEEDGPLKSSFTSGDVHKDGYLLLLQ